MAMEYFKGKVKENIELVEGIYSLVVEHEAKINAGQFYMIIFSLIIPFTLSETLCRFIKLTCIIFVLKQISDRNKLRFIRIGYIRYCFSWRTLA